MSHEGWGYSKDQNPCFALLADRLTVQAPGCGIGVVSDKSIFGLPTVYLPITHCSQYSATLNDARRRRQYHYKYACSFGIIYLLEYTRSKKNRCLSSTQ